MRHGHGNEGRAAGRARKITSGVLAGAVVVAAHLLVVDASVAAGQDFHDLVIDHGSARIGVAIPSVVRAHVDATRVAAPELPDLGSLGGTEFVAPVLERREAVLPAPPRSAVTVPTVP